MQYEVTPLWLFILSYTQWYAVWSHTPMIVYTFIYAVICSMKSHPYDCLYCHIRSDMQYEVTPLWLFWNKPQDKSFFVREVPVWNQTLQDPIWLFVYYQYEIRPLWLFVYYQYEIRPLWLFVYYQYEIRPYKTLYDCLCTTSMKSDPYDCLCTTSMKSDPYDCLCTTSMKSDPTRPYMIVYTVIYGVICSMKSDPTRPYMIVCVLPYKDHYTAI
jgi:hypothetical protein